MAEERQARKSREKPDAKRIAARMSKEVEKLPEGKPLPGVLRLNEGVLTMERIRAHNVAKARAKKRTKIRGK